jgi:chromosome condensin MukBEF ATPase and DNA-binding subunit MukB
MQISKSRLKQIVKEELDRVNENYHETEQQQVSDLDRAYEIAVQLEQFVPKNNELARKMVGELVGILADVAGSEAQEIED